MTGWLRADDGPVLYSYHNRTPVTGDLQVIIVYLIFATLYIAFLLIFPGIRKERFATFVTVTLSLFVGNVIMVTRLESAWHVATTEVVSTYRAFSRELVHAELGAYIGLGHVNITLRAISDNSSEDIDYNERFSWLGSTEMGESYREALVRGVPFPILKVAEYFSLGEEGFTWGGQYRAAGYYGGIFLWAAFACWLLMNLLLVVVPRYGAYAMTVTGALMLGSALAYHCLLPSTPLRVRFENDMELVFHLGWCFYLVIIAGGLCLFVGLVIAGMDLMYPHSFSTVLEVDYDTPYDRHVIIEESHTKHKHWKKGLEEPPGLGRRILRRLSSKKEDGERSVRGLENRGFEMDPPKSPWRYPLHRPALQAAFKRTLSQDSAASGVSLAVSFLDQRENTTGDPPPRRTQIEHKPPVREASMW
ncbi:dual oxidase maturation factor 1 [Macrosteles quadrilineatus]|uniref:dual oxidase maturation factor 1 n=1 Tax=Macrosteles quadrilineatus TaxID=74068 RepID=UPI0023E12106|nr:dual oxidase maturation factor 1 [Macrosteles quadrilineatus]XP_054285354.1 dual oxidase maturation factor 1 [Macrosteles quadrilineatus]